MLPISDGNSSTSLWTEGEGGEAAAATYSWSSTTTTTPTHPRPEETTCNAHGQINAPTFSKSMLETETDWFIHNSTQSFKPHLSNDVEFPSNPSFETNTPHFHNMCSQSSFFPPNSYLSSLFNVISNDPFEHNALFEPHSNFLLPNNSNSNSNSSILLEGSPELFNLPALSLGLDGLQVQGGFAGNGALFSNWYNNMVGLRPLEVLPLDLVAQQQPLPQPPTLFQKRAARRCNSFATAAAADDDKCVMLLEGDGVKLERKNNKRNRNNDSELGDPEDVYLEDVDVDEVSCLNYDSDDPNLHNNADRPNGNSSDGADDNWNAAATDAVTITNGDEKGKKKGPPAKNLMAERRRRKKLNDRLYMLRSIVPKISKMDRASILGDAIGYLKELLQRINDLHHELEATPPGSLLEQTSSFHPLTPTLPTLPYRVKEELSSSSLPSSKNSQPAQVEVILREGRAVNIHMFCARRPGLLLSTISALDNLGLEIQQAVISCFNGFALDVFRAEQCREGQDVLPEQVKAVLLDSAGYHGVM